MKLITATIASLALVLAACGGDDDDDDATTPTFELTHTRAKQAEAGMDTAELREATDGYEESIAAALDDPDGTKICDDPEHTAELVAGDIAAPTADWVEIDVLDHLEDVC